MNYCAKSKVGEVPLPGAFPRKGLACGRSGIFSRSAANGETSSTVETVTFLPDWQIIHSYARMNLAQNASDSRVYKSAALIMRPELISVNVFASDMGIRLF